MREFLQDHLKKADEGEVQARLHIAKCQGAREICVALLRKLDETESNSGEKQAVNNEPEVAVSGD